jgi:nucleotide-binding universal stress UspA family protein
MFKKILIPLDGSSQAENALRPGLWLAQQSGAEVILLRAPVYKEAPSKAAAVFDFLRPELTREETRLQAERYLKSVRQMQMGGDTPLRLLVQGADAAAAIVDVAAAEGVDLIVMSTHGRTGLRRWLLGSVTEKVVRAADRPLLVVRSAAIPTKIVITLDGSPLAERALAPALALARCWQTAVTLLRVIEPADDAELPTPGLPPDKATAVREKVLALARQEAQEYLRDAAAAQQPPQATEALETAAAPGLIAETILDYAQQNGIDLIALSSHGQHPEARWAYGSVAEKLIHGSDGAVLIIPAALANN